MPHREAAPDMEPGEFARIREQCDLSLLEVSKLLDHAYTTWHNQETGRRRDRRFGALARAVPWLIKGDLPPWCEEGAQLAPNPRLLSVHARSCVTCWDTLEAASQVIFAYKQDPRGNYQPNIRLQEGQKLRKLQPWWNITRTHPNKRGPCLVCGEPKLSLNNKSGVCQGCQKKLKEKAKRAQGPHVWDWRSRDDDLLTDTISR